MSRLVVFIFLVFSLIDCYGQEKDTMSVATTVQKGDTVETIVARKPHSPKKATIMSAIVPGSGQIYNGKWWKVPIIYGGFAGLGYLVAFNSKEYNTYKDAYILRVDDDSTTVDIFEGVYTDANLLELQNYYRRNRDFAVIGAVLLYVLNIIDANVDGHLYNFDVSEDLSMKFEAKPLMLGYNKPPGIGIGISLRLK